MAGHWYQNDFFKYTWGIISVLLGFLLLSNVWFIFEPVLEFILTLLLPVVIAGIFYYMLRPFVHIIIKKTGMPKIASILIVYFCAVCVAMLLIFFLGPLLVEQFTIFKRDYFDKIKETILKIDTVYDLKETTQRYIYKLNEFVGENVLSAIEKITKSAILVVVTPLILFYMLKDDDSLYSDVARSLPLKYEDDIKTVMNDIDAVLSTYVISQVIVAIFIGCILLTGYLIIGLENAVILAVFGTFFVTIPILGSFIAIIPALIVGLSNSPIMAFKVVLIMLVAHLLEGTLISPHVLGSRLKIHPLTLLLILLASGFLYGIIGLFFAAPVYAVIKVVVLDLHQIFTRTKKVIPGLKEFNQEEIQKK